MIHAGDTMSLGDDDEIKHHMIINMIYAYTICSYVCVILWVSVYVNAMTLENAASLIVVSYAVLHRYKFNEIQDWGWISNRLLKWSYS